jgi:A/G-specific adenine glycosylase
MAKNKIEGFKKIVWAHYKKFGRHDLPWRHTRDIYKILVSEVMLQQTQVERVIPFYRKFIKEFPTAKKLAAAPLSEVLKSWQGLGYNRRAKMLHEAAKELAPNTPRSDLKNLAPRSDLGVSSVVARLEALPGVGPYTARAVAAFAWNEDVIFVETNIRTAIIHHFFNKRNTTIYRSVSDAQIEEILRKTLSKGRAREWYNALLDYGAYLKRSGISHNARSKKYTKQSKFAGSAREARGTILREFTRGTTSRARLVNLLGASRRTQMKMALKALVEEGLISGNLLSTKQTKRRRR